MRILSFDIESCTGNPYDASLCSFGYVVAEDDKITEQNDVLCNPVPARFTLGNFGKTPEIKFAYTVKQFRSQPRFDRRYRAIKGLFESADVVIGFALQNDLKFINNTGNDIYISSCADNEKVTFKFYGLPQKEKYESLALTNYFLTEGGDNHDGRGYDRYSRIKKTLRQSEGVVTEDEAMKLLSECVLNYKHPTLKHQVITLWSAVYNCTERSMNLCAGMDYSKEYKFFVDKPCEVIKVK